MARYLIEFRFQSKKIRRYLEEVIYEINKKFKVGRRKHIPHVTLIGPLETTQEKRLISDFARVCSQTKLMKLRCNGFGTFDSNRVVKADISASEGLNEFRTKLVEILRSYCKLQQQDKKKDIDKFGYHSTLAMNLNEKEFNLIKAHIKNKSPPNFTQIIMRVTLLRNGKILSEYDFIQRRLFNRRQALNKHILIRSKTLLKEFMKGRYNPNNRLIIKPTIKKESFIAKIKKFFGLKW